MAAPARRGSGPGSGGGGERRDRRLIVRLAAAPRMDELDVAGPEFREDLAVARAGLETQGARGTDDGDGRAGSARERHEALEDDPVADLVLRAADDDDRTVTAHGWAGVYKPAPAAGPDHPVGVMRRSTLTVLAVVATRGAGRRADAGPRWGPVQRGPPAAAPRRRTTGRSRVTTRNTPPEGPGRQATKSPERARRRGFAESWRHQGRSVHMLSIIT